MPGSSDNFFTGKNGHAAIGATVLKITGWNCDDNADRHDVTNTSSGGHGNIITGVKRCPFTIEMNWDAAANPLDSPPSLGAGSTLSQVKLFLDGATSPFYLFPVAKVLGTPVASTVGDVTKITCNCESDGPYTRPTGNFTPQA